jgi:hypothetical protein
VSDEPLTAGRLRIVADNGEVVLPRPRKAKRRFAQVDLDWLGTPAGRRGIAPPIRLYLLLQFLTRQGTRSWKLTNDEAARVGLDRHQKCRYLKRLEVDGMIRITRNGRHTSEITLVPMLGRVVAM